MLKKFIIICSLAFLPALPATMQTDEQTLAPRFRHGAAIIQRPADYRDANLQIAMTADHHWVVAPAGQSHALIFRWDISTITDERIYPQPDSLDVGDILPEPPLSPPDIILVGDMALVQFDTHLVQVEIPSFTVTDSVDVTALFAGDVGKGFGALAHNGSTVAALYERPASIIVWNLQSGETATRQFNDNLYEIFPFRDGWIFTDYGTGGTSVHYFCDMMLTECIRESVAGEFILEYKDVLVFGTNSMVEAQDNFQTTYYTFDNGLIPAQSLFPQLPSDRHVPLSISPDGQFMLVGSPFSEGETPEFGATRCYGVWRMDGNEELRRLDGNSRPFWFNDHELAQGMQLLDTTSPLTLDEFAFEDYSIDPADALFSFHGGANLVQISPDGSQLLFQTSWAALVMTTEMQRVDDLATVGTEVYRLERPEFEQLYASPYDSSIVIRNSDTLTRIDLTSGETVTFDASPYRHGDDPVDVLVREQDMFVLADSALLRLQLSDFTILEEIAVDDRAALISPWAFGIYAHEGVVANGDLVGALFENTLLVWDEETGIIESEIGDRGIQLHAAPDGWLVYQYFFEEQEHFTVFCDLMLTACETHEIDQQLLAFDSESLIVTGDIFLRQTTEPSYWLLSDGLEETAPLFDIPASYRIESFNGDYVMVDSHTSLVEDLRNDVWSRSENRRIEPFYGEWRWLGEAYLVYLEDGTFTFLQLLDGRFRRWRPDVKAVNFEILAGGTQLLVVSEDEFVLYKIVQ
ncbi:MAG: hypothetical protein L0154_20195 [Chloroflexi bacterium]|nr:hypothetical protein [Chloroflexota bacterium]